MADISMCRNNNCPKAKKCYRVQAPVGRFQSYMEFKNMCTKDNGYRFFMPI